VTREQATSRLNTAIQWLEGPGSEHPGATAAKRAMASFLGSFASGALHTPEDEEELGQMIVSEGRLYLESGAASLNRQIRQLEDAIASAIVAARKGPWPTATISDLAPERG
jgi:hypothetical protein